MGKRAGDYDAPQLKKMRTVVPVTKDEAALADLRRSQAKLASDVRKLKSDREVHYHDELNLGYGIPYDVNRAVVLCDPPQGDARTERVGDTIRPYWIDLRGSLRNQHTRSCVARITLVQSKQRFIPSTTAASGITSVWNRAAGVAAPLSTFTFDNRDHFTVLWDKTFTIGGAGSASEQVDYHLKKKLTRPINYAAGATTFEGGGLYLLQTSEYDNASGVSPVSAWVSRVYFHDE